MRKINYLAILFYSLIIIKSIDAQSSEQKCIISDGVPNHKIGQFPTKGNPNKFKKQNLRFCFPKKPVKRPTLRYIVSTVGVTLTGIPIRPGTAAWYDSSSPKKHSQNQSSGLNLEAIRPFEKIFGIDDYNGHLDFKGLYHYHKPNPSLLSNGQSLIGYAADGFEILYIPGKFKTSWRLKKGNRKIEPFGKYDGSFKEDYVFIEGSGDLDECNGRFYKGTFKYFATNEN